MTMLLPLITTKTVASVTFIYRPQIRNCAEGSPTICRCHAFEHEPLRTRKMLGAAQSCLQESIGKLRGVKVAINW
jgi:hypothetical protein